MTNPVRGAIPSRVAGLLFLLLAGHLFAEETLTFPESVNTCRLGSAMVGKDPLAGQVEVSWEAEFSDGSSKSGTSGPAVTIFEWKRRPFSTQYLRELRIAVRHLQPDGNWLEGTTGQGAESEEEGGETHKVPLHSEDPMNPASILHMLVTYKVFEIR